MEVGLLPRLMHGDRRITELPCRKIRRHVFSHFIVYRPLPSVLLSTIFVLNTLLDHLPHLVSIYGAGKYKWGSLDHYSSPLNARASITWDSMHLSGDPAIVSYGIYIVPQKGHLRESVYAVENIFLHSGFGQRTASCPMKLDILSD